MSAIAAVSGLFFLGFGVLAGLVWFDAPRPAQKVVYIPAPPLDPERVVHALLLRAAVEFSAEYVHPDAHLLVAWDETREMWSSRVNGDRERHHATLAEVEASMLRRIAAHGSVERVRA